MKIYTQAHLNTFRKHLRNNMPQPERKLWFYIRNKQLGIKFRRQHSIGKYVVDFFCCELKLAIEIDGNSHFTEQAQAYDHQRTRDLNKIGIKVLRFTNNEVNQNLEEVLVKIMNSIPKSTSMYISPSNSPLFQHSRSPCRSKIKGENFLCALRFLG